jgi:hypothetical protein
VAGSESATPRPNGSAAHGHAMASKGSKQREADALERATRGRNGDQPFRKAPRDLDAEGVARALGGKKVRRSGKEWSHSARRTRIRTHR